MQCSINQNKITFKGNPKTILKYLYLTTGIQIHPEFKKIRTEIISNAHIRLDLVTKKLHIKGKNQAKMRYQL